VLLAAHEACVKDCAWLKKYQHRPTACRGGECCGGGAGGVRAAGGGCRAGGSERADEGEMLLALREMQADADGVHLAACDVVKERRWDVDGDREVLGDESLQHARQMLDTSSDDDTCVVVFFFSDGGDSSSSSSSSPTSDAAASQTLHGTAPELLRQSSRGYAWIFQAGKRPRPRTAAQAFGAPPASNSRCVRYSGAEVERICRTAVAFREKCGAFRGILVGSIEYGLEHTEEGDSGGGGGAAAGLAESLREMSEALGVHDRIMPHAALCAGSRLLVVSGGVLEGVPLGALPLPNGKPWSSQWGRCVSTAPSLAFACITRGVLERQRQSSKGSWEDDLEEGGGGKLAWRVVSVGASAVFSSWEAKRVLEAFETWAKGGECLAGGAAVAEDIRWALRRRIHLTPPAETPSLAGSERAAAARGAAAGCGVAEAARSALHLACHARRVHEEGSESGDGDQRVDGTSCHRGLLMADCHVLTTAHVRAWDLSRCPLVVMSACSSVLFPHVTDDSSLPGAFVIAGAPTTVGALWEVPGASTAALFLTFYRLLLSERLAVSQALCAAQAWLRQASMEDVVALLPARGATAARLRGRGFALDCDPSRRGRRKEEGRERAGQKRSRPFANPFYWAGFVVVGEG